MIVIVTALELVPRHNGSPEKLQRLVQATLCKHAGLRRSTLLHDRAHPTHYLIVSEWAGHDELAAAVCSGSIWRQCAWMAEWLACCPRIYDEVVEIGETVDGVKRSYAALRDDRSSVE